MQYEKTSFPNCQGDPIAFNSEDGSFRAPEYVINSMPNIGQAPYAITYVTSLPQLSDLPTNSSNSGGGGGGA